MRQQLKGLLPKRSQGRISQKLNVPNLGPLEVYLVIDFRTTRLVEEPYTNKNSTAIPLNDSQKENAMILCRTTELEVEPDETILSKALDSGLDVPHDCKLGVCMTCPAKLLSGSVDQSEGMLSDDVVERGYALLCVSYPKSDCKVRIIPEEELWSSLQLATANDR
ncbi:ferredoxin C 1, chloroplastic-like [Rhododendron vialii]|uniref:ferredoxin C 1, chloroplastic-like n=1 Tax=Rhododendron vialii TaxID=182163 RepID=UPI00265DC335|nr:ferredoxin C 1, chloroplastic-like [Rhododendron vialii]